MRIVKAENNTRAILLPYVTSSFLVSIINLLRVDSSLFCFNDLLDVSVSCFFNVIDCKLVTVAVGANLTNTAHQWRNDKNYNKNIWMSQTINTVVFKIVLVIQKLACKPGWLVLSLCPHYILRPVQVGACIEKLIFFRNSTLYAAFRLQCCPKSTTGKCFQDFTSFSYRTTSKDLVLGGISSKLRMNRDRIALIGNHKTLYPT